MNKRTPVKSVFSPVCHYRLPVSAAFLMVMLTVNVTAQKEDKIKSILKASDIKKIEKTDEYKGYAEKLMEEANQLYIETTAVKSSTELDEKDKKKKIKQLEGKARQKITAASGLFRERNETKYRVYKTYIEKFWLQFEGDEASFEDTRAIEEQSNDLYFQAVNERTEAGEMPAGYEKIQKLKQAMEYEAMAIDRQLTVLGLYYHIDLAEKVMHDETVQPIIAETAESEPVAVQIQPRVQQDAEYQPAEQEEPADMQQPVTTVSAPVEEQPQAAIADPEPDVPKTEPPVTDVRPIQQPQQQQAGQQIAVAGNDGQPPKDLPEVEYRIQVAASKTPLTKEKVAQLCSKSYTIGMVEENGWCRYHIVAGNSYEQAKKILRECGVEKAFIVTYKNGRRITISEASQTNP